LRTKTLPRVVTAVRVLSGSDILLPPPWVWEIFDLRASEPAQETAEIAISIARGQHAALISARIRGAVAMAACAFEKTVIESYRLIRQSSGELFPVRFWNHIPAIHAVMDAQRDRYMVFNAGRFHAFETWYGSANEFSRHVATASGVGHTESDLVIHCLACDREGSAVENPRQIAAYRYSKRYGPLPPCFARATVVRSESEPEGILLVGGTASIRGEDSMYRDDLELQIQETFDNLGSLVVAARGLHDPVLPKLSEAALVLALQRYAALRVYYRRETDLELILDEIRTNFGALERVDLIQAELCRPELLVEVEGIARL